MKRLFVAIKINPEDQLCAAYRKIKDKLYSDKIKWVKEDNLHITLNFLGDIPDKNLKIVAEKLRNSLKGVRSFDFLIEGFGYFGSSRFPRVLWLGIQHKESLPDLFSKVNSGLKNFGAPEKNLAFKPHLTIGRVKEFKSINSLFELEAEFTGETFQAVRVNEVILFESILKPTGPVYRVVDKVELGKKIH